MTFLYGLYTNPTQARQIVAELVNAGFDRNEMEVMTYDNPAVVENPGGGANFHDNTPDRVGSFADTDQNQVMTDATVLERTLREKGLAEQEAPEAVQRLLGGEAIVMVRTSEDQKRQAAAILYQMADNITRTTYSYMRDIIALQQHIADAVTQQVNDGRVRQYPELLNLVNRIDYVMKEHTAALERHLGASAQAGNNLTQAVGSVASAVTGLFNKLRDEPITRMLRDDYTALSLTAMNYTILHTVALAEQVFPIAELAQNHLAEVTPLLVEISRVLPFAAVAELRATGVTVPATIAEEAITNTQQTWSKEVVEEKTKG